MLAAKSAIPNATGGSFLWPLFQKTATAGISLFTSSAGYFSDDGLVEALREHANPMLWLRLGREDRDPATLLLSIIESARRLQPGIGGITLEKMKLTPGPLAGWPALYTLLAQELADGLPASSAIVLEHVHHLAAAQPTLGLLGNHLLARLPASLPQILTTHQNLPASAIPLHARYYSAKDLRIDFQYSLALAEAYKANLPKDCLRRALQLVDGRGVTLAGILAACQELGPSFVQSAILRSKSADQLLTQLVRASLAGASPDEIRALVLSLQLDYCHPELSRAALSAPALPRGPWVQSLSDGWSRLRYTWQAPLNAAFQAENRMMKDINLITLAEYLARQGAVEKAVELCLSQKHYPMAARLVANAAEAMMDLGQWATLEDWLKQLPKKTIHDWPQLLHIQGEIVAAQGQIDHARLSFNKASILFLNKGDISGGCQSLLAESVLSAQQKNMDRAQFCALAAHDLARTASLGKVQSWADWQLGCLAVSLNHLREAQVYITRAMDAAEDTPLSAFYSQVNDLIQQRIESQEQLENHYHAYRGAEKSVQEATEQLEQLLNPPIGSVPGLFPTYQWSDLPMMFRLVPSLTLPKNLREHRSPSWRRLLQRYLGQLAHEELEESSETPLDEGISPLQLSLAIAGSEESPLIIAHKLEIERTSPGTTITSSTLTHRSTLETEKAIPIPEEHISPSLEVYCLGPFRVYQDDQPVIGWPSSKSKAIFKYLFTHRERPVHKDILMDLFWPSVDPDAARNNLNVAIYGLRQVLRKTHPSFTHVMFQDDCYLLNPEIQIWVDSEAFQKHLSTARTLEQGGEINSAIKEYCATEALYQGEFMEEDRYEDWLLIQRQRLQDDYLGLLNSLSNLYFNQGDYIACITACRKTLVIDPCSEEIHRLLMCCYVRQEQPYLALRQFHICVEALQNELEVAPSSITIDLYRRIRRHE